MSFRFVLRVQYGTGSVFMPTNEPDLIKAIEEFKEERTKGIPDTKMYGLPDITAAELFPLMYRSRSDEEWQTFKLED